MPPDNKCCLPVHARHAPFAGAYAVEVDVRSASVLGRNELREEAMKTIDSRGVSRRAILRTGLAVATLPAAARVVRAAGGRPVATVQGFETSADVAKAEQE